MRNLVARKALNCVNGAFADRWREVTEANGKANAVLEAPWASLSGRRRSWNGWRAASLTL